MYALRFASLACLALTIGMLGEALDTGHPHAILLGKIAVVAWVVLGLLALALARLRPAR